MTPNHNVLLWYSTNLAIRTDNKDARVSKHKGNQGKTKENQGNPRKSFWDNYDNYTNFGYVGTLNHLRWGQHPSDWDDMKSHGSPHIGEQFGDNLVGFWWGLRLFKRVLVVILDPSL